MNVFFCILWEVNTFDKIFDTTSPFFSVATFRRLCLNVQLFSPEIISADFLSLGWETYIYATSLMCAHVCESSSGRCTRGPFLELLHFFWNCRYNDASTDINRPEGLWVFFCTGHLTLPQGQTFFSWREGWKHRGMKYLYWNIPTLSSVAAREQICLCLPSN